MGGMRQAAHDLTKVSLQEAFKAAVPDSFDACASELCTSLTSGAQGQVLVGNFSNFTSWGDDHGDLATMTSFYAAVRKTDEGLFDAAWIYLMGSAKTRPNGRPHHENCCPETCREWAS